MGFYVNPGNESFEIVLNSEIYVDKSMMLAELNRLIRTDERFLCVSRPRRFGKTIAGQMMAAYYSKGCDSSGLFAGLEAASDPSFPQHLNKYNVLHLDINAFWSDYGGRALSAMRKEVVGDFKKEFPNVAFSANSTVAGCIRLVYERTRIPFVVIFDEYDVIFREKKADCLIESYLALLNGLFKSSTMSPCIALAYLTGILPIIREKAQSKLNNFSDITFLNPDRFARFTGFTEDEVRSLCEKYGMAFDECRSWYDGYRLGFRQTEFEAYSPKSVVSAMRNHEFREYWNQTSQYEAILDPIRLDMDGMRADIEAMVAGESVPVNITSFLNTPQSMKCRDDVFTYLCHLGYLAYDLKRQTCRIPNREVRGEWLNALAVSGEYSLFVEVFRESKSLLEAVWSNDSGMVAQALSKAHERLSSSMSYNNEQSLQSAIRLAFIYADGFYTIVSEYPAGKGYADLAFIPFKPDIPAIVVELKVNGSVCTALDQIREKRYFAGLDKYEGNILLVGISYDRKTKKHECQIEKA